jgi:hypothetical protein
MNDLFEDGDVCFLVKKKKRKKKRGKSSRRRSLVSSVSQWWWEEKRWEIKELLGRGTSEGEGPLGTASLFWSMFVRWSNEGESFTLARLVA